ncbi:hypothetical protein Tco_0177928, partial [Tanacetum coccineum]
GKEKKTMNSGSWCLGRKHGRDVQYYEQGDLELSFFKYKRGGVLMIRDSAELQDLIDSFELMGVIFREIVERQEFPFAAVPNNVTLQEILHLSHVILMFIVLKYIPLS